jgi:class 3 adenylate cyclase/tetratricopeptide (TPR) repeat protein
MHCSSCGSDNPAGAKFCMECAAPLPRRCPSCGTENPPQAKFCAECATPLTIQPLPPASGSRSQVSSSQFPTPDTQPPVSYTPKHLADKILTTRSALEGERRQVTVLFADTAGFTALAEKLDPEDVHQILDRCFELITAAVHRFEGTINPYTGDGVMALFGAPIAHEDGPRRVVHAALAIQQALRDFSKDLEVQHGFGLRMRIGLNTGLVVVGKIGDDLRMDYTAVGDTTNLAARMQQLARPGSVVVTEATHKLIAGFFETLDLGEVLVKGHTPVHAFEVLRPRGRRTRLDAAAERGLTPLVGRARELATLLDLFREVKTGRGQVVLVTGEAGIGKSRLLLELRRALAQAGEEITWLEGRCISFGQSIPLLPVIDQLRENFGIEEFDGEPEIIAKVEHGMRRLGGLEAHIPYIRYLLAVDPGDPAIAAMDSLVRRRQAFEALRALTGRGASLRPSVLVYEDLHWIDSSSEEYLGSSVDSVVGLPLLLILTYRIGYTPPFGSRSFFTTLNLHSLSETETSAMAGRVLGTEQFPQELKAALMEKAEGVPLFIEEVTKTLLDLGVLRRENGGYRMVKGSADVNVPDTIQGIIMARLDRLGEDGKRTMQLASVIGRQFLVRLLERISGLTSKLEGLLADLQALEFIYRHGLLPEPAYIFKHAVIQDVAYNSLLVQRRKELHRAVGAAIEELYADRLAEHQEELAYHYERGEVWEKALEYSVKAGQKLQQAYANREALDHYNRALAICERLGNEADPSVLLTIHAGKGAMLFILSEFFSSVEAYQHMREVAQQLGNRTKEAEALYQIALSFCYAHEFEKALEYADQAKVLALEIGAKNILAGSLYVTGFVPFVTGKLDDATRYLGESLQTNREGGGDKVLEGVNLLQLGHLHRFKGEHAQALQLYEQGITTGRTHNLQLVAHRLLWGRSLALCDKGEYEQALACLHEARGGCERLGDKFFQCRILNTLGWVYGELYNLERAIQYNKEGAEVSYQLGEPEIIRNAEINLGDNYLLPGDTEQAQQYLEKVYRDSQQSGKWGEEWMKWRYSQHCCHSLGELWLTKGDADKALRFAEECLQLAEPTESRKNMVKGWRLQGQAYCMQGRRAEAEAVLQKALALAQEIGNPPQLWKTYQALGELYEHQGATDRARSAYATALEVIEGVASRLQDQEIKQTFLSARPVQEIRRKIRG